MGAAVATPRLLTRLRRLLASLLLPLVIVGLCLFQAQPADAARGGRMGGGSFRAPSMPRSGGSYRGGSYGGGYRGGGMGFPFLIPIFGFGGGGLFGLLILMAVAGVLVNALRGVGNAPSIGGAAAAPAMPRNVNMIQVQVGLLASAKSLQEDLRSLAASSDTSSSAGLQRLLQETTLALLRQPDLWVYANAESGSVPFSSAESTFNRLSMNERSKLDAELTSNVGGQRTTDTSNSSGDADATNEFIVVTLLVASTASAKLAGA
ncbi:MAG: DUF1517 domain-containing protein, partial [Cyanobacteriota bacterium]|nr:DUF1517 domain-containing protein [Cyanobacteriota bacterium]